MRPTPVTGEPGSVPVGRVGPVLARGPRSDALVAAIRELNREVEVIDRGAYLRVLVRGRCRLTRAAVERHLEGGFRLPADLEEVMVSFAGTLAISSEEAVWT
jgi:toluene monooxygenase system protein D